MFDATHSQATTLKRASAMLAMLALFGSASCGESFDDQGEGAETGNEFLTHFQALTPMCTVNVQGGGTMSVEDQYLPGVVACENGNADFEALKAQAIAARTFLKYKVDIERIGSIRNSQADQVSSCGRTPTAEHIRAVQETRGQVITHNDNILAAFYVSGVMPSTSNCRPSASDIARASSTDRRMEERISYNEGNSGASVRPAQRPMGLPGNPHNRGVMSQNGSSCLSMGGRNAASILRFYYGDDIRIEQLGGSCGGEANPDTGPARSEPSTPGNPQEPNTSGASTGTGTSGTPSGSTGDTCVNGGVTTPSQPRSIWGATPPTSNRAMHTPNRITFHHTAQGDGVTGPSAVRQIQNWHKQAYGMADIGYHYIIDRDGTVYTGTPDDRMGAHQKGQNDGNIGVAFIGTLGAGSGPTTDQVQSAIGLGVKVANKFGFNLGKDSLLGGFLNGGGAEIISNILDLLFGGLFGGGSSPDPSVVCGGSINGDPSNGIQNGTMEVEGTSTRFNYVRLTALSSNTALFPLDAFEVERGSQQVVLDEVLEDSNVSSPLGATQRNGMTCADVTSGRIAALAPGGSIVLGHEILGMDLNMSTGRPFKVHSSQGGDLSSCTPSVGGSIKIEFSADNSTWVTASEMSGMDAELVVPSLEGNTSGGGNMAGGGNTGGDPVMNPSGNLGGNNGSGGADPVMMSTAIDMNLANRLVEEAKKNDGQRSKGLCWKYVKQAAGRAGLSGFGYTDPMAGKGPCSSYNYQLSAYCGGRNWNANPNDLQSTWGFTKVDVHPTEAPAGSIIFWDKGCNGFHVRHGHVEIAIGNGRACSDYCGTIKSGGGSCSYVFAPTGM